MGQWDQTTIARRFDLGIESSRMTERSPSDADRFVGCLLGLAIGDALGANFEGRPAEQISTRHRTVEHLIQNPPEGELWYTDDTQMAIGVAETLVACRHIDSA